MPELIAVIGRVEIIAPSRAAADELRRDFETSALEWLEKASAHGVAGRGPEEIVALRQAALAYRVACGRTL